MSDRPNYVVRIGWTDDRPAEQLSAAARPSVAWDEHIVRITADAVVLEAPLFQVRFVVVIAVSERPAVDGGDAAPVAPPASGDEGGAS